MLRTVVPPAHLHGIAPAAALGGTLVATSEALFGLLHPLLAALVPQQLGSIPAGARCIHQFAAIVVHAHELDLHGIRGGACGGAEGIRDEDALLSWLNVDAMLKKSNPWTKSTVGVPLATAATCVDNAVFWCVAYVNVQRQGHTR